jgi:ABC-type uncharacterized transport system substrate-binding protein
MVADILNGKAVGEIPIMIVSEGKCIINIGTFKKLGFIADSIKIKEFKAIQ